MAKIETLVDAFNGTTLNSALWSPFTSGSATLTYSSSGASCNFPTSSTSSTDGDITSQSSYDLTGSYVFQQVPQVLGGSHCDSNFTVRVISNNGNNILQWQVEAGTIFAIHVKGGTQVNVWSATYSSTTHKWWRIREGAGAGAGGTAGTVYWDTSTDGTTWTNRASWVWTFSAITTAWVNIGGIAWGADTNAGAYKWNNLNTTGSTSQTISPTGISSTAALGSPTLTPGSVTISPTGKASTLSLGSPTIQSVYTISPVGIALTTTFGAPTLSVGPVTLSPTGISSTVIFGSLTLQRGTVTLSPTGIASTLSLGSVALSGAYTLSVSGIASSAILGSPTPSSMYTLVPTGINSTLAFGTPSVATKLQISPSGIASGLVFGVAATTTASFIKQPAIVLTVQQPANPVLTVINTLTSIQSIPAPIISLTVQREPVSSLTVSPLTTTVRVSKPAVDSVTVHHTTTSLTIAV